MPRINQLAEERLPLTLAISLHAARDQLCDVLVPINKRYPLNEPVDDAPYREPDAGLIRCFKAQVGAEGLSVTLRDTRGREENAACGKLRSSVLGQDSSLR